MSFCFGLATIGVFVLLLVDAVGFVLFAFQCCLFGFCMIAFLFFMCAIVGVMTLLIRVLMYSFCFYGEKGDGESETLLLIMPLNFLQIYNLLQRIAP